MLTRLGPRTAMTARASSTKGKVSITLTIVMIVQSTCRRSSRPPRPEQHADGGRQEHGGHPDQERDAAAVDHAREEVAPDLVGAEQVLGRAALHPGRRRQPVADVHDQRVVGRDPRRQRPRLATISSRIAAGGQAPAEPPEPTQRGLSARPGVRAARPPGRRARPRSARSPRFTRPPGCADR